MAAENSDRDPGHMLRAQVVGRSGAGGNSTVDRDDRPTSSRIHTYKDLIVWQKGRDLAVGVYGLVQTFPPEERYGLRSQLTRAASSVPANIAEGHGRFGQRDYAHFISVYHAGRASRVCEQG